MLIYLLLIFGVFTLSTAVIMIKLCTEHAILVASYRLLIASILLLPLFIKDYIKHKKNYSLKQISQTVLPGIVLGLHFITWIIGARMTLAVNSSIIVNMMPVAMPFFLYFLIREKLNKYQVIGTLISLVGVMILAGYDMQISEHSIKGDIICIFSMLFLTFYLALARKNKSIPGLWLYVVPLYFFAGFFCFILSLFILNPIKSYTSVDIFYILGLAVIPTVIGHSIINYCMQKMHGQIVAITNLAQFIFAGILAYFILKEVPVPVFYVATALVVTGALIVIKVKRNK